MSFIYLLDVLKSPNDQLAFDEWLLNFAHQKQLSFIRFWETKRSVVLGYSNAYQKEVNVLQCQLDQVPIYRRCSGGGTIIQGKGCLNISLVLCHQQFPTLSCIQQVNEEVMKRHQKALSSFLNQDIQVQGITDLTLNGLKFSGNAQRRKGSVSLFHGTFLYDYHLPDIEKYLGYPSKEPEYRQKRDHLSFVCNLRISQKNLINSLCDIWSPEKSDYLFCDEVIDLCRNKYDQESWIKKF